LRLWQTDANGRDVTKLTCRHLREWTSADTTFSQASGTPVSGYLMSSWIDSGQTTECGHLHCRGAKNNACATPLSRFAAL